MSGWIYIITNLAMPDLVKVELSNQQPEAKELALNQDENDLPFPFVIEHKVAITVPQIFRRLKEQLVVFDAGKGWYRRKVSQVIFSLSNVQKDESRYTGHNGSEADKRLSDEERNLASAQEVQEWRSYIGVQGFYAEQNIKKRYKIMLEATYYEPSVWKYCLFTFITILLLIEFLEVGGSVLFWGILTLSIVILLLIKEYLDGRKQVEFEQLRIKAQCAAEIAQVRAKFPDDSEEISFERLQDEEIEQLSVSLNFENKEGRFFLVGGMVNKNRTVTITKVFLQLELEKEKRFVSVKLQMYLLPLGKVEIMESVPEIEGQFKCKIIQAHGYVRA
jgi:hypothetical protein